MRYSFDKHRKLLMDIKTDKNYCKIWCSKPSLVGENRENMCAADVTVGKINVDHTVISSPSLLLVLYTRIQVI